MTEIDEATAPITKVRIGHRTSSFMVSTLCSFSWGPLIDGHLDGLTKNRLEDDGSDNPPWLQYEREVADSLFINRPGASSSFGAHQIFGEGAAIKSIYVGRALDEGSTITIDTGKGILTSNLDSPSSPRQWLAAIVINLKNVIFPNGQPYRPTNEVLSTAANIIAVLEGRKGVRWMYTSF
jgi:hypothetical protein